MIILPDRNIPRSRILLPVHKREWRTPSQAQQKDFLGNENRTRFCITARLNDGYIKWRGWFDGRDDFDAFIYALVTDSLQYERELWKLPTPWWHPDLGTELSYSFITFQSLTTVNGANQTFNIPSDWNNASNAIQCIGTGSSSASANNTGFGSAGGGAGGAWAQITNSSLTPGGTAAFFLNSIGTSSVTGTGSAVGIVGISSWFRIDGGTTAPANTSQGVLAEGGAIGGNAAGGTGTQGGATGGRAANSIGSSTNSGGSGGAGVASSAAASGGGGGAGGPSGVGANGSTGTNTSGAGGAGDNATGGTAGTSGGGNGGNGSEIDTTNLTGAGGGGGGNTSTGSTSGGAGGNYGAGGGGAASSGGGVAVANGGQGKSGLIVVSYTPATTIFPIFASWGGDQFGIDIVSH